MALPGVKIFVSTLKIKIIKSKKYLTVAKNEIGGSDKRVENQKAMTKTKDEILSVLKTHRPELEQVFPIKRTALFESWLRDEAAEKSDVDILVDVDPAIGLGFVTLAERLEELLSLPVDLVSRRAIKPSLWRQIETELIKRELKPMLAENFLNHGKTTALLFSFVPKMA